MLAYADLYSPDYGLHDVLAVAKAIMDDPLVQQRALARIREWMREWSARTFDDSVPDLPDDTYHKVLDAMTAEELKELHERLRHKAVTLTS